MIIGDFRRYARINEESSSCSDYKNYFSWPPFPDPYSKSAEDKLYEVYSEPYFFNRNAILDISLLPEERHRRHGFSLTSSFYFGKRIVFSFLGVPESKVQFNLSI